MSKQYDHQQIESKWRKIWEEKGIYSTPENAEPENKFYILPQLPYPSGSGLHMGHSEVYAACDIYARHMRMLGKDVLQVIGWDSFGLPAENYAIKTNVHPRKSTEDAIDNFREQIKSLGVSVDWDREVGSHNSDYYKWTQWFFKLMYERGLAYRKKQTVNWCPHDKTVLANEQVENGECERCGNKIELREMEQWYLKITEYADRLIADLDKVDWPEETVKRQRDWIGRSEGAHVEFDLVSEDEQELPRKLEVFTTRPDTLYGVTFMVVAPEHFLVSDYAERISNFEEVDAYVQEAKNRTELERQQQKEKTGVKLNGVNAVNPLTGETVPVFVADYVLASYGTGAIMAVPAHDERDKEFAEKHGVEILEVVDEEKSTLKNSGEFNGLSVEEGKSAIITQLENEGVGRKEITYKLRDWSISRQRFWGAPIPVVYDPEGNPHLVEDEDLPVMLPDDVDFKPTGQSPLTYSPDFHKGVEEKYGEGWKREVDTMDTFMCSSWYYFRYIDPHNDKAFASQEALKTWMPVDYYLGGPEHVNGHLLYSRFFTKVLFDAGIIDFDEPFLLHRHQGMILGPDGKKMSKRRGNVINPTDVVEEYGADTARVYLMFMGPLEQDKSWNQNSVIGVSKFIRRIVDLHEHYAEFGEDGIEPRTHKLVKFVTEATADQRYNVVIAEFMKMMNEFEGGNLPSKQEWEVFIKLLAPYAPFVTEEIWESMGNEESVHNQDWPEYDEEAIADEEVEVAIQVNGKTRDRVMLSKTATEEEAIAAAKQSEKVQAHIDSKVIRKVIYVPSRIINLVV